MINTLKVNADFDRDFRPLVDHMTKLRYFAKVNISAFPFSLHSMFDQRHL